MKKKVGFTIGKFAPLHKGHEYLIETALKEMDEFYVVIYDTDIIDINIEKRAEWIKTLYPKVKIIYAYNSPKEYGLDKKSVEIQMNYLKPLISGVKVTHFYSSELYGEKVANWLKIENRNIDIKREHVPISAKKIRDNYEKNKSFIEDFVFEDCKLENINKKINLVT